MLFDLVSLEMGGGVPILGRLRFGNDELESINGSQVEYSQVSMKVLGLFFVNMITLMIHDTLMY